MSMKTKESTRKLYARPQMTVVELRHQCCILAASGEQQRGGQREDYIPEEW